MSAFFAITLLILLAAISPGPDFAMVTKNALFYSRKAGIYTAAGVATSLLIHSTYCLLGLAIVISKSLLVFSLIKYLGAAYLIYIGIKSLLARREETTYQSLAMVPQITAYQAFRQGLLCNVLNPKAIMFILAFFTIVVRPGNSMFVAAGYGVEIAVIHLLWFSALATIITHGQVKRSLHKVQYYLVKAMGALLVAFGVKIAMLHQSAH